MDARDPGLTGAMNRMRALRVLALLPWLYCAQSLAAASLIAVADQTAQANTASPRGLDSNVYIRLQTGMSEGELLLRAGRPDSESVENFHDDIVKTYYYLPTASNPWITAITLRGGRIANIDRTKKF
jgi:hypothetical protein